LRKLSYLFVIIVVFVSLVSLSSCNKKDDGTKPNTTKTNATEFVKSDANGQKVTLKYVPKKGDIFKYKSTIKRLSNLEYNDNNNSKMSEEASQIFYSTQEVYEINSSGYITYKITYDSSIVTVKKSVRDSSITMNYNSNIKDSVYQQNIIQNAYINNTFKFRISPIGEIEDVLELENILNAIYKNYGDTLKQIDKSQIKESVIMELKSNLQSQFQILTLKDVYKDSSWTKSTNEMIEDIFPIENTISYRLKNIEIGKDIIVTIEPSMFTKFIKKEEVGKGSKLVISDDNFNGVGTVSINLSKGVISRKDNTIDVKYKLTESAKGQSLSLIKSTKIINLVELL